MRSGRGLIVIAGVVLLLLAGGVARIMMPHNVRAGEAWGVPPEAILGLRLTRVFGALSVGGALALSGVMLQTLLRNPLASPSLLGLSSGSALGVTIAAYLGYLATGVISPAWGGAGFAGLAAVVGCGATLGLVYALAQRRGALDPVTLVLVGAVVAVVTGAATQIVQRLLPDGGVAVSRMLVGVIRDDSPAWMTGALALLVVSSATLASWGGGVLDAMSLDEDEARSVGVPVGLVRAGLLCGAGLLAAGAVVVAGPIGFVGLVAPHAARLVIGPGHRWLVVSATLLGAAALLWADVLVGAVTLPSGRLPVGAVTALVGGPVFVWMLRGMMVGRVS